MSEKEQLQICVRMLMEHSQMWLASLPSTTRVECTKMVQDKFTLLDNFLRESFEQKERQQSVDSSE